MKTYKCGYPHCTCTEVLTSENAVKISNKYYHKECANKKQVIQEIREYYLSHIDSQVVLKTLNAIIKSVVVDKKVSPNYLLFALKYAYETGKPIKSPQYLHYLASDKRIQRLYKVTHLPTKTHRAVSIDTEFDFTETETVKPKTNGFGDIIPK